MKPGEPLFLALTLVAAVGCGVMAGVFFAFSSFVMTALGRLPPGAGIAAMQSVNVAVINPLFFAALFGTAAVCAVLSVFSIPAWRHPGCAYLPAGALLYLGGTMLVTLVCNVPLNDALARAVPGEPAASRVWAAYLTDWTAWNHVRTAAAFAAAVAFSLAYRWQPAV